MSTLMLRYSKDGGNNFSDWRNLPMGDKGQFLFPVEARRFGRAAEEWIFELSISDPVDAEIMGAAWLPEQTEL